MIPFCFLLWIAATHGKGFDEPSPLMTNKVTMAVAIDKGFFAGNDEDYRKARSIILDAISDIARNKLHVVEMALHAFKDANGLDLRRDYTMLLSIATCDKTWRLYEAARQAEVAHLAITSRSCPRIPRSRGISIPLIIAGEELPQIFLDLRTNGALFWKNVIILHDDSFDREKIGDVVRAMTDKLPSTKSYAASRSIFSFKRDTAEWIRRQRIREILASFHAERLGNYFLVVVTVETLADVMEIAGSLKMVHPDNQWLYVLVGEAIENVTKLTYLTDLLVEGGNVAFVYNVTDTRNVCSVDLLCHIKEFVYTSADAVRALYNGKNIQDNITDMGYRRTALFKSEKRQRIIENMNTLLNKGANCGKCLHWRISSGITWGNHFLHEKRKAHLIDTISWTLGRGINLSDVIFPHVVHGFRGAALPLVTFNNPPWQTVATDNDGSTIYGGLIFDVLKHLSKKLNFTYSVTNVINVGDTKLNFSRTLKVGDNPRGRLMSATRNLPKEVVDLVRSKKVFLAACAYTVNELDKNVINFTIPIFVQTYSFLTARPQQLSRALLFTSPFTKETWACLAASIIIMGPILYLVHKYSPCSMKTSGLNSSWQCIWYVYGALLQQGGMYLPHSDSARILVGTWWLIVMVLVATYSGSLIAFLTFPKMDASILTVADILARRDTLTWGFPNGSFLEEYLQNSNDEKYHLLLSRSERHNATEEEDVIRRVKEGKHVFIDWRSSLRTLMGKELSMSGSCHFSLSTEEFMAEPIAMIVPRDSPYLSIINNELHRMHESGLMNKWISEKMPSKDKCWDSVTHTDVVDKRKVNVADMQGIFFVLFMGIILAIILLCCEFYWHRRKLSKERKLIHPFVS